MTSELFYAQILSIQEVSGVYTRLCIFKYRINKNGSEGRKSFRDFRETRPKALVAVKSTHCKTASAVVVVAAVIIQSKVPLN